MKKCRQLACVCRHAHDRGEWKPTMKNGSQVYYPTREEAEYSAALSWSIGLSVMQHLLEKGRVKLAIPVVPMLFNETGDRTKWCKYPPHLTRDAAMVPMAVRLGFHPTGVHVRLQSTEDPDYMNGRKEILPHELYIGAGNARLKWPPSEWKIDAASSLNQAEVAALDFALWAEQQHVSGMMRQALRGKSVVLCDCKRGWPCHGECFVALAAKQGNNESSAQHQADAPAATYDPKGRGKRKRGHYHPMAVVAAATANFPAAASVCATPSSPTYWTQECIEYAVSGMFPNGWVDQGVPSSSNC